MPELSEPRSTAAASGGALATTEPAASTGPAPAPEKQLESGPAPGKPRSLWSDAWHDLRRNPMFLVSAALILFLLVIVAFPGMFTSVNPRDGDLQNHFLQGPQFSHWFSPEWLGYDGQGRSIYTRIIYGTRASVIVGVTVTAIVLVTGTIFGLLAGYFGGWIDTLISRVTDIFFGIPFLLGAMVVLTTFEKRQVWVVVAALAFLGWTSITRVMRGSVITTKQSDYVTAAKALGAGTRRILTRHILPNAIAPVIVVAMINLGGYISAEATLSYLGIGLSDPTISWGIDVSSGKDALRVAPHVLLFPSLMLSFTILAFIMLGDAVRNALDPKLR
ncbi:ABC transporter permease [Streptomyces sp. TP-A0874]|uniref:ABC transporter permease n=1 Tax=Streptomyces sp. TP-A0874 TaxID=549819 RepID=UPI0009A0157B|nr:ABC transporter permease [Streptomyces sp. TP-A0874]